MSDEIEVRESRPISLEQAELRAEQEDGELRIKGYGAVFNSLSHDLGGWREIIHPDAFSKVLRQDVHSYFNHDPNMILGRVSSNTLRIWVDDRGLGYSVKPPKSRADVIESLERGDVTGSSFAFSIAKDGEAWTADERGKPLRTITKVSRLYEVGPVVSPAYPDTSAARRSLNAAIKHGMVSEKMGVDMDSLRRRLAILAPGSR